jgi:hypothetical protein
MFDELGLERDSPLRGKFLAFWKPLADAVQSATVQQQGATLQVAISARYNPAQVSAFAKEILPLLKQRADRTRTLNNLHQIGMAMHMYHHDYQHFPPPVIYSRDGKPLLSWRVLILPYLEEENLYKQFRFDEPWDSEHNKTLLAKMPKVYAPVGVPVKEPHVTYYQVFNGPNSLFESDPKRFQPRLAGVPHPVAYVFGPRIQLTQGSIPDGMSNTLMVIEAAEPVPWTKPEDIPFDPKKPLPQLGPHKDGFHALFADGAVRFLRKDLDPQTLRRLIDRRDGEVINFDALR